MDALPPLFLDLAVILVTAGVITVVFKWLRQPLVLGYIVAGFFVGPYFPWFPGVSDTGDVKVWSDIGIVFLMFALGLDFSVRKLKKVGGTGAITALTELLVMFLAGFTLGHMLGWRPMERIFLGCMLSISSTTIIVKSFDDLRLKQQRFASTTTAVLVVEDLVAVLLLVLLSTLSVGRSFDGGALAMSMARLAFFLLVWFLFGIFLIPTFLRWMRRHMTEETLCIVAVGLCFLMVVAASYAGFSTALGAFIMGAILAETIEADVIGRVIAPVKNLFGAVFFVSVGMMVNPSVLARHILPILLIALVVVLVKPLAATTGILVSGKPLRGAVQSGFCFCNIGEFSFIIAGLGVSYGVIGSHLYPIIVSVSIVTTFVTPYMIKGALPFHDSVLLRLLPARAQEALARYAANASSDRAEPTLRRFVRLQLTSIVVFSAVIGALAWVSTDLLKPVLNRTFVTADGTPSFWGNLLGCVGTLLALTPFLWALMAKNVNRKKIKAMLKEYAHSHGIVVAFLLLRAFLALASMGYVISQYIHPAAGLLVALTLVALFLLPLSRRAVAFYGRIEDTFRGNLNERQQQHSFQVPQELERNFHMERMTVSAYSSYVGRTLQDSGLRQAYGVNVVSVERAGVIHDLPPKEMMFMPQDRVTFLGDDDALGRLRAAVEVEPDMLIHDHSDNELKIESTVIEPGSPLAGVDLRHSNVQRDYHALVIAIQHGEEYITNPPASQVLQEGDVVWYVSPDGC